MTWKENWIWLDSERYPDSQTTFYSGFHRCNPQNDDGNYTVAEFTKQYCFQKRIISALLHFSADTEFRLYCNDQFIATGPVPVGGDYHLNEAVRNQKYATEYTCYPESSQLRFYARVKMMPVELNEYSLGHGEFMLCAKLTFEDGEVAFINTDDTWLARKNPAYKKPYFYDGRLRDEEVFSRAVTVDGFPPTESAPLPIRTEDAVYPENGSEIVVPPNSEISYKKEFDRIYAGFLSVCVQTQGMVEVEVDCYEESNKCKSESLIFYGNEEYVGLQMHSAGKLLIHVKNTSDSTIYMKVFLTTTYYPISDCAKTTTSDYEINHLLSVCAHSLKYCRQLMHLDSPNHCEPLACTGDYYIETLMTAFSFGDMTLSEFDIIRTANSLRRQNGVLFHTTYSMIWILMLYHTYLFTGHQTLLENCFDAMTLLLDTFDTYMGENGLIENPPNYMFVDWIYLDGLSLHHPPKCLGQTCLNMFFYGGLKTAARICDILNHAELAKIYDDKAARLRDSINTLLFDQERDLYFEGLNTETPENLIGVFMPQNVNKRYYLAYSNILAAYFGICGKSKAQAILKRVMENELGEIQPYFAHFLFEAIYTNDLREQYTLQLTERWKEPIRKCSKGLPEGFIKPEPSYKFDLSHAWGGTPLWSIPQALTGLTIIEPGFKNIAFSPSLLGLEEATVEMLTPYGKIICRLRKGNLPKITAPAEIPFTIV